MKLMLILLMAIFILITILTFMINSISMKTFSDREKNSPFECGFDPKSSSRMPFSLSFFMIAIIFLIFDIEISILLPLIISLKLSNPLWYMLMIITFIMILIFGLIHEWIQGALNWNN